MVTEHTGEASGLGRVLLEKPQRVSPCTACQHSTQGSLILAEMAEKNPSLMSHKESHPREESRPLPCGLIPSSSQPGCWEWPAADTFICCPAVPYYTHRPWWPYPTPRMEEHHLLAECRRPAIMPHSTAVASVLKENEKLGLISILNEAALRSTVC